MTKFNPALLVIDIQEDFLPPNGSLAVKNGRDIIPIVNKLTDPSLYQWSIIVFTQDWHPKNHISFASNHEGAKPFSEMKFKNPDGGSETKLLTLWPDHCVQGSLGAQFGQNLNFKGHPIIQKGTQPDREFYSAFSDVWHSNKTNLEQLLTENDVTHVYICGLAYDYCVLNTAIDSAKLKYPTYVLKDVSKAVDPSKDETVTKKIYEDAGVELILKDSELMTRVRVGKGTNE